MIDLDAMEAYLTGEATNGLGQPLGISVTLALVAELRAARESERRANSLYAAMRGELRAARRVVKAARGGSHPDLDEDEVAAELADAIGAYDRAVAMREAGR